MRLARWRLNGETVTDNPHTWTINTETTVNVTFEPVIGPVITINDFSYFDSRNGRSSNGSIGSH